MIEQQEIYYRYIRQPYEAGLDLVLPDADDWDYDIILDAIYAELDRRKGFVYENRAVKPRPLGRGYKALNVL